MELLVDTHVLIWGIAQPDRLSTAAADALADPDVAVLVSAASAWELATKVRIGKLPGGESLVLDYARNLERWLARELPVSSADALLAGTLSWTHRDPFDRMLAAQALRRGCALVSSDRVFDQVGGVHRIW
ncbi:MAG: PIN domain nuclease [Brachybacterium faecium]|nr:MAG: PIN domain nuclease [Brachybacterium faecium]